MKITGRQSAFLALGLTFAVLTICLLVPKKSQTVNRSVGPVTLLTTPSDLTQKPFEIVLTEKDMGPVIQVPSNDSSASKAKAQFFSKPNLALIDFRAPPAADLSDLQ